MGGSELDSSALMRERAPSFSREFADFITELSRANAGPDWWTLSLPGKNPLTLPLVERALALAVKAEAPAPRSGLKRRLNRLAPTGPLAGLARAACSLLRARRFGPVSLPENPSVFFTFFGPNSFDGAGKYRDMFFGPLIDEAARRGLAPLVWGAGTAHARPGPAGGPVCIPLDYFLGWGDLWRVFRKALSLRASGVVLRGNKNLGGIDLTELLQDELDENLNSSRLFSDLWYGACAEALLRRVTPAALYYPFENLARERCFLPVFRTRAPRARVVGYQHASLTTNHLNLLLGRGEADILPLPDRIVTTGEATKEFLRDWGRFPESLLRGGCALRQEPAAAAPRNPEPGRFRLLVAAATSAEELSGILRLLENAYGSGLPAGLEIILRPHPLFPLAGPARFPYRDGSGGALSARIREADAVAYVSSTAGIEALANGLPAIGLDLGHPFGIDPLAAMKDLKWTVRDGAGLRAAVEAARALAPEELARLRELARLYTARYLTAPSPAALEAFFS